MFERLLLASIALSAATFAVGYEAMLAAMAGDPRLQAAGLGGGFLIGSVLAEYAIYLVLWYLIARRGVNWAKWVFVAVLALGLLSVPSALGGPINLLVVLGLAVVALRVLAAINLFRPDAIAWLRGEDETDPAAFD
ncbi:MAG: hypothetical protein B7Z08_07610 [Sphingomonadales bacterium 32-68-7]|nr:MAG: hypothetical protein B7Z33_01710 [Sphingomonadales bacterium 12-68-11]OYX08835.1 MAG: hypothetical protein B7Z08_07610 [Sphingomonadales bacterium 32-68-7]